MRYSDEEDTGQEAEDEDETKKEEKDNNEGLKADEDEEREDIAPVQPVISVTSQPVSRRHLPFDHSAAHCPATHVTHCRPRS